FIGVHVGLGAGPGLEHGQREFLIAPPVDYFLRRAYNQRGLLRRQHSMLGVGQRRALFDDAERPYHGPAPPEASAAAWEILQTTLRLRSPETIPRHLDFSEPVPLDAGRAPFHAGHA